ncbi:glycosyl hydrolase 53 family protein [Ruminococcus callidus]|jgi:arabinogalactan endo-1,4-beta-galactosidase|uniref:glycosyl hydrolase 53 family protein n=2 Tax=Ruminococcus TaxID=1263 RepID=UPI00266B780E|nr:glycosyl hydrolase 53 family protein [uncultured Ruminococcus sp.]
MRFKKICVILSVVTALLLMDLTKFPLVSAENDTVYFSQFDTNVNGGEPIRGVDISSILAVENAGVTFCNEYGRKQDIFRTLSEHGVNYIRVRVWNEPYDSRGNSYGGGNCDLYTAAEIGRRAAKYGMKLLVDIQYSDFWADPEKQTRPKYWIQHDHETLKGEIYKYTAWVLETISEAGGNIGMVQVGNETNCFFCGETDMYKICDLFASGDQAIRDFDRSVLIAHHFANPSTGSYAWYAQAMDECNLDYDVFATSYYPYWHGTTENLTTVLKEIADTYNKYVMVAETAYPYTSEDGDTFGNAVSEDSDSAVFRYDISVEGQAQCLTDVFQAVANVGEKGIGVFYWEPAWLGVNGISWEEQSSLWKKYGSGWATDYAAEYDASVTGAGGSSYDNQALFDFEGNSLKSLQVFRNIYPQNNEILNPKGAVIENGRYRIKNVNSELFISEKNGNAVQSNGTVWTFTKNDDDTFYITTLDGRALTVEKSADTNGTNILLQKHKGDTSQKYTLCRNTDGTYALLTAASNNKSCLDVYNISKEDGANICQWEYWGGNGQKFILEPVKEIEGDVNADGALSVIDAILLQKWLLAVPDAELTDWKAADLCEDNIINVFDLHLLKRMLLEQ